MAVLHEGGCLLRSGALSVTASRFTRASATVPFASDEQEVRLD